MGITEGYAVWNVKCRPRTVTGTTTNGNGLSRRGEVCLIKALRGSELYRMALSD